MRKMKHSWGLFRGSSSKREKAAGENARMLPKTTWEERNTQQAKKRGTLKNVAGKLLKTVAGRKEAAEKMRENENLAGNLLKIATCKKEAGGKRSAEESIHGFIEQGKFFEACKCIYNLECSGRDGVGKCKTLHALLAERMWSVVGKAFSGCDRMFLEPLQSVSELLRWAKEKKKELFGSSQGMEPVATWSPGFWKKDLEEKLIQYMTAQIPPFHSTSSTDETALTQHLRELEMSFMPRLEHKSGLFKEAGLLATYTHCAHACLSSHLSTLTDMNRVSFSQCLLVYEWCLTIHQSGKWTLLGPSQTPHAQCLVWIILKMEEKLLAITQGLAEKTEAARRVGGSLPERVGAACLQESLAFLHSYENEARSFLQLNDWPICSSLRVLENCCILRVVWHKLICICSASTDQDAKVKGFLERLEYKIVEQLLQKITSKVKRTLKDHFKKCDSGLGHILESLKQNLLAFEGKNTATYEVLVKAVSDIITKEYVQALLTISRKPSSAQRKKIVSRIEEDHRMLQTIITECLGPKADFPRDPIKAVLELIQTTDPEGMKIALMPILGEFPNLR
ncbi:uncharacterized protein ACNFOS_003540 [Eudromia elegans]